jgi:NAD(P)-dependent dehydrogenase (short-subunit alcohol dehydrogenase family)
MEQETALIIGAGCAHNAPLARALRNEGWRVRLVVRCGDTLRDDEPHAETIIANASG